MYEATTTEFKPFSSCFGLPPDVDLHTRFDEREVSRSHANLYFISENLTEHLNKRISEVSNIDIFSYNKSFNLVKHHVMRCVDFFVSIDISEYDCLERKFLRLE